MPTIPTTMRVAAIDEFDGPEVLKLYRLSVPAAAAGEVLIRIDDSVIEMTGCLLYCLGQERMNLP
jgi:hypothetical protein